MLETAVEVAGRPNKSCMKFKKTQGTLTPFTVAPNNLGLYDVKHLRTLRIAGSADTTSVLDVEDERCAGGGKLSVTVTLAVVVEPFSTVVEDAGRQKSVFIRFINRCDVHSRRLPSHRHLI